MYSIIKYEGDTNYNIVSRQCLRFNKKQAICKYKGSLYQCQIVFQNNSKELLIPLLLSMNTNLPVVQLNKTDIQQYFLKSGKAVYDHVASENRIEGIIFYRNNILFVTASYFAGESIVIENISETAPDAFENNEGSDPNYLLKEDPNFQHAYELQSMYLYLVCIIVKGNAFYLLNQLSFCR